MKKAGSHLKSQKLVSATFALLLASHILFARVLYKDEEYATTASICGKVHTTSGESIALLQGVEVNDSESLNKAATFSLVEKTCMITACGDSDLVTIPIDNDSKSPSSYEKCIKIGENGSNAGQIYEQLTRISSLRCDCLSKDMKCKTNCKTKAEDITWPLNTCAFLYEELYCNTCSSSPVNLTVDQYFHDDGSRLKRISAMIIRNSCVVAKKTARLGWIQEVKYSQRISKISQCDTVQVPSTFTCTCDDGLDNSTHQTPLSSSTTQATDSHHCDEISNMILSLQAMLTLFLMILASVYFAFYMFRSIKTRYFEEKKGIDWKRAISSDIALNSYSNTYDSISSGEIKREILDELKQMLENFLARDDHDERHQLCSSSPGPRATKTDVSRHNTNDVSSCLSWDDVSARFRKVCQPYHIFERGGCTLGEMIGKGRFGHVYKGYRSINGKTDLVALKKIPWPCSEKNVADSFLREIRIYEKIGSGHENILTFLGACCASDGLYIMTKFCEGGSLDTYLIQKMRSRVQVKHISIFCEYFYTMEELGPVDLYQMLHWSEQIATGMLFLHSNGIFHVDLAIRNILLTADFTIKICDFGLSRQSFKKGVSESVVMQDFPLNSFAPEWVTESLNCPRTASMYSERWAFGCTLYELYTLGGSMYSDVFREKVSSEETSYDLALLRFLKIVELLKKKYRHPKPQLAPDSVYHKMLECWNEIPCERPDFQHLQNFFKCKKLEAVKRLENT